MYAFTAHPVLFYPSGNHACKPNNTQEASRRQPPDYQALFKMPHFTLQKAAYCSLKHGLLQGERPPPAKPNAAYGTPDGGNMQYKRATTHLQPCASRTQAGIVLFPLLFNLFKKQTCNLYEIYLQYNSLSVSLQKSQIGISDKKKVFQRFKN